MITNQALLHEVIGDGAVGVVERAFLDPGSHRIPKTYRLPLSAEVPARIARRDLTSASNSGGAAISGGDPVLPFGQLLRSHSLLGSLGARFVESNATYGGAWGKVKVPYFDEGASARWLGESEEDTESTPTIVGDLVGPLRCAAHVQITRTLLESSDSYAQVLHDLTRALAAALDAAVLNGGGTNEPTGMLSREDIDAVSLGTNGGPLTHAAVIDAEYILTQRGFLPGKDFAWLLSPAAWKHGRQAQKISGYPVFIIDDIINSINASPAFPHAGLPDDLTKGEGTGLSGAIVGHWPLCTVLSWGPVEIQANPFTLASSGVVRFTAYMAVNYALRQPGAFVKLVDIDTSS